MAKAKQTTTTPSAPKKRGNPNLVKGVVLNPNGRPAGSISLKTKVQEAMIAQLSKQIVNAHGQTVNYFDQFNENFFAEALTPGTAANKFLSERLYSEGVLEEIDAQINKAKREDADFIQYRVHKRGFDIQQKVLLSKAKDIGLMAGRRAGKTETNKLKSISVALEKSSARVLIVGLTIVKTQQIYWDDIKKILTDLGIQHTATSSDGRIELYNGSFIQFGGNSNKIEREKYRGMWWDLIIIDEAQSQPDLGMFIKEIIQPMLLDTNGTLMLTGSGPRTRGTFWEHFYSNPSPSGLRLNWNLSYNPHIHNYTKALEEEKEKHALSDLDPIYLREYLGLIVYDDDALVYRLKADNYYSDEEMLAWMNSQSPEDIKFTAGLDFGFRDSDAFVVIMYSEKSNEKFIVWEYKQSQTDVTTLCEAIKAAKEFIKTSPIFSRSYHRDFDIFADTSDQKISLELSHRYGIPVHNAYKYDKALAIIMLQEEVRKGNFKVRKGSAFDEEALRIIFKRVEIEGQPSVLTREIDDEVYHPDLMDAILYSLRSYWLQHPEDHKALPETKPVYTTIEQDNFLQESYNRRNTEQLF